MSFERDLNGGSAFSTFANIWNRVKNEGTEVWYTTRLRLIVVDLNEREIEVRVQNANASEEQFHYNWSRSLYPVILETVVT